MNPWTARAAIIMPMFGATAQARDDATSTSNETSSGSRRPRWSETGPPASWPSAMPTKNVVSVNWTEDALADRSRATWGKAGTYMSVASGAIEPTSTIVARIALVSRSGPSAGIDIEPGSEVMALLLVAMGSVGPFDQPPTA